LDERIDTAMDEYSKAHGKEWLPHEERNRLRKKQDKIIKLAARQNLPMDSPISSAEGAPTIADLKEGIYPKFAGDIDAFLNSHSSCNP
jgi:hypothetical protein